MSYYQNSEPQKKKQTPQPIPMYHQSHSMPTPAQNFPMHGAQFANTTGLPRTTWPLQHESYPGELPTLGQTSYHDLMQGMPMADLPNSFPATNHPSAYNPQTMSPHQQHSWSNTNSAIPDQAGWERSHLGFGDYQQQPSPSRSDGSGSSSTQRSSVSSPYTNQSPFIKQEDQSDLPYNARQVFEHANLQQPTYLGTGPSMIASPQSHRPFTTSLVSTGRQQPEDVKYNFDSYDMESLSLSGGDMRTTTPDTQPKRGFTTPDTASCQCEICGKLFQRSNNLKTHMQTHLPNRSHPHKCEYVDCSREFVRKTDLARHEQSVHLKERNYPCHQCGNCFARKDTLTRHVEDGCSKRPEVKKSSARSRRPSARHLSSAYASQSQLHSQSHTPELPGASALRYPMRPA